MPSRKVTIVFIMCIALVVSIWLLTKSGDVISNIENTNPVQGLLQENTSEVNDEWKKILVDVNSKNQNLLIDLTKGSEDVFNETTLTAQISRDFMSQYLLLKNNGRELTEEEIASLAEKVLSDPKYVEVRGAVYKASNLKVINSTDKSAINTYKDGMFNIISDGMSKPKYDPALVVADVLRTEKYEDLSKLDHIIVANKKAINDLLNIPVPKIAVNIHLALLNSLSNILADLESIRVLEEDPFRSFSAVNQYDSDLSNLMNALSTISRYIAVR